MGEGKGKNMIVFALSPSYFFVALLPSRAADVVYKLLQQVIIRALNTNTLITFLVNKP